jgi:hypothetical protein
MNIVEEIGDHITVPPLYKEDFCLRETIRFLLFLASFLMYTLETKLHRSGLATCPCMLNKKTW